MLQSDQKAVLPSRTDVQGYQLYISLALHAILSLSIV